MSQKKHNPNSYIHQVSMQVVDHLIDEDGICDHTSVAIGGMFGVTEQTIYTVRVHLESCPDAKGYKLPYRRSGPLVLIDADKNLTTLEDLKTERAVPVVEAFMSVRQTLKRIETRNVASLEAMESEAYASGNTDLAQALGWAANDIRTIGDLSPAVEFRLRQLGVLQ